MNRRDAIRRFTPAEKRYWQIISVMSSQDRMARVQKLHERRWKALARMVELEMGKLPERELRYFVARKVYADDLNALHLLERAYNRLTGKILTEVEALAQGESTERP